MSTVVINSQAGSNGVLHLTVPLGLENANQDVQVTVEPVSKQQTLTRQEWSDFIARTAGQWRGDFEKPSLQEFESRDSLS